MKLRVQERLSRVFVSTIAVLGSASAAKATVGPPVKIKMPADTKPAVSGQPYEGVFEVHVLKPGQLADLKLLGDGWTVVEFQTRAERFVADPGVIRLPFKAIPADADRPIGLSLTFNGRQVRKTYEIGPAYFAQAGKPKPSIRIPNPSALRELPGPRAASAALEDATSASAARGGTIRCVGRIIFSRPDAEVVGADRIDVRVMDVDVDADDEIWSGWTDENGFFDTGERPIPGDSDGSGPDLVLYYEAETDGWVEVTDGSLGEYLYWWDTDEIEDFDGTFFDFGWVTPAASSTHPAIHVFNTITRAHRFIQENPGYDIREVQVEWPATDGTHYDVAAQEIHLDPEDQWSEDVAIHEYGHHVIYEFHEPPEPNYCQDPSCGCGHCIWCQETDHDAFNEGWPNWLADVVVRALPGRYLLDGGRPYDPMLRGDFVFESLFQCGDSMSFEDPIRTEGFVAALLRDMEDDEQDDHDGDGVIDLMCIGANPLFAIVATYHPITVLDFINGYLAAQPQNTDRFWSTAFNVGGTAYVSGFPGDVILPGAVPALDSPSHPPGVGGPAPCITFEFDPAPDDARGASVYSYLATPNPAGQEPDETPEPVFGAEGCKLLGVAPVLDLGTYYISIKAQDNAGNWSNQWATFGPFEVTDCNGTGILDVCDISCASEGIPGCQIQGLCTTNGDPIDGCGMSSDCQPNGVPDECDLAEGTSEDCNLNGIPDECESMKHWKGGVPGPPIPPGGCCYWDNPGNWEEGGTPATGDEVCIAAGLPASTLRQNVYSIGTLACHQDLSIIRGGGSPGVLLTLSQPSFVLGDLTMSGIPGNPIVEVMDELIISGTFDWSSGTIRGSGETTVTGGLFVNGAVALQFHTLNLQCDTLVSAGGDFAGDGNTNLIIHNFPGYTYTQAEGVVHQANNSLFINEGMILKPSGSGELRLDSPVNNAGEIRIEAGSLRVGGGLVSSGSILGLPGTTMQFNGSQEFTVGSSVVGDHIIFHSSAAPNARHVRGTYEAGYGTTIQSSANVTFHPEANVMDYGDHLLISSAVGHFEAVVGSTIDFQTMTIAGDAYFDSGDPIVTGTLSLGDISGDNKNITVNGLLTWNNGGNFFDTGVINANGGLFIAAGGTVKNLQSVLNNAGVATVQGAFGILSGGAVNNMGTGLWDIQVDGNLITGSTLVFNNAGTLVKSAGTGTSTIGIGGANRPQVNNTGTVEIQTGVLAFSNSDYTQNAGQTILNGGGLSMTGTTPGPVRILGGELTGFGTVTGNVNNAAGEVAPGLSAGQLNITGNYTQPSAGSLEIELGGPTPGTDHDWLAVTGSATLFGTLRVDLINGFIATVGQQFTVVTAGSVGGAFTTVESLTPGLAVNVIYNPTSVVLEIIGVPLAGDCDGDGDVDLDDYAQFPACLSGPGIPYGSPDCDCIDANQDGAVDLTDFAAFQEF